jgi:hypothetical protein
MTSRESPREPAKTASVPLVVGNGQDKTVSWYFHEECHLVHKPVITELGEACFGWEYFGESACDENCFGWIWRIRFSKTVEFGVARGLVGEVTEGRLRAWVGKGCVGG